MLVALAAGLFSAIVVGLATAWRATRVSQQRVLASAGAGATMTDGRLRTALVAIQITAAVVLVIVTGLYLENAPSVPDIRLGFDTATRRGWPAVSRRARRHSDGTRGVLRPRAERGTDASWHSGRGAGDVIARRRRSGGAATRDAQPRELHRIREHRPARHHRQLLCGDARLPACHRPAAPARDGTSRPRMPPASRASAFSAGAPPRCFSRARTRSANTSNSTRA